MLNKHPVAGNTIKNLTKDQTTRHNTGHEFDVEMENGSVGMLLAVKAFVQLFFNPIIGNLSGRFGYKNLIFFGTINLLLASLSKLRRSKKAFYDEFAYDYSFHGR
jgi:MFS family permease